MQQLHFFRQARCKPFTGGVLFRKQLRYKFQFSHFIVGTERPLFPSFTRAEFHYCSSALHWWLHGRGRDLKNVKWLWINAGKRHLFLFLLLPFYQSSCCQSVRKLIYPSLNLSRWQVTKLSETLMKGTWRNKILNRRMYIQTVAWLCYVGKIKKHDLRRPQQNSYERFAHHSWGCNWILGLNLVTFPLPQVSFSSVM